MAPEATKVKFSDLPSLPVCDFCGKKCMNGYGCLSDSDGYVEEVYCTVCDDIKRRQRYMKDKEITTHLMLNASLYGYDRENKNRELDDPLLEEIWEAVIALEKLAKEFSSDVWHSGLCKEEDEADRWGKSASFGNDYTFLTMHSAGRVLFTLQNKTQDQITLIAASGEKDRSVGLQGVYATKEIATKLLRTCIDEWEAGNIKLEDTDDVGFG